MAAVLCEELDRSLTVMDALQAFRSQPLVVLLDSAARHRARDARYSFLTAAPVAVCRLHAVRTGVDPFEAVRDWQRELSRVHVDPGESLPPFFGGIAGLMSYELGHAFERLPVIDNRATDVPALLAGLFDWAIVWDHLDATVRAFAIDLPAGLQHVTAAERMAWIHDQLLTPPHSCTSDSEASASGVPASFASMLQTGNALDSRLRGNDENAESQQPPVRSNFTRPAYLEAVGRVIEYIRAGDIFQANLSQQLSASWSGSAVELYGALRQLNPAPFCGLLKADEFSVVSASPERFLKVSSSGHVETRPIKGTRRRLRSNEADLFAANELSASGKDRAENVMIVDLLRNDLSRSCEPGSVRVTGLCEIERFETVLHLVSTVEAQLRPDRDVWDLLAGSFPGGSITGAPKIRAMEIITELERTTRGAYCGSLFALGPRGDFDSSILIRTFTLRDGIVTFPVGGGIVADSNPLDEYRETLHKASGMIRCLQNSTV